MPITLKQLQEQEQFKDLPSNTAQEFVVFYNTNAGEEVDAAVKKNYDTIDGIVSEVTGQAKGQNQFTSDYVKKTLAGLKISLEEATTGSESTAEEVKSLKAQIKDLQDKSKPDAATQQQLKQLKEELTAAQNTISQNKETSETLQKSWDDEKTGRHTDRVRYLLDVSEAGIALNEGLKDDVKAAVVATARAKVMGSHRVEFQKTDQGEVPVFFQGEKMVTDPSTGKPADAKYLLSQAMGSAVSTGQQQSGTGGGAGGGSGGSNSFMLNGARSRVEATRAIGTHLSKQGLVAGTPEHAKAQKEIYTANQAAIQLLPEQ